MKRTVQVLLILLPLFSISHLLFAAPLLQLEERDGVLWAGDGFLMEERGLKVAYFTGTPLEIGMQHGLLIVDDPDSMRELMMSLDPSSRAQSFSERLGWFFRNLYARFRFYPAFLAHTPSEYVEEMKGFILGASRGEEDNYYEILMGNAFQDLALAGEACSVFAAFEDATLDGELIIGRNLDHPGLLDLAQYQFIGIYHPDNGYPFMAHNYPSFIGTMTGMNSQGLVISSNYSIAVKEEMAIDGLPFMLMIRHVLQYAASIDEALEMIRQTPRTVGLNLLVADTRENRAVIVEHTANRMAVREEESFIYSSNRFLHPYMREYQAPGWLASHLRDERFLELLEENKGEIHLTIAQEILKDTFEPGSPQREGFISGINSHANLASMIFLPGRGQIWVGTAGEEIPPFTADSTFVGIDVQRIWETGRPVEPLGVLPPTIWEGYNKSWLKVRRAEHYFNNWENEKALDLSLEVLEEYPTAEMPLLITGQSLNRMGRYDEGLYYLDQFLQRDEHGEPFHLMRVLFWSGLYRDHLGMREEAVDYYKRALEVEIEDMSYEYGGVWDYCKKGLLTPLGISADGRIVAQDGS